MTLLTTAEAAALLRLPDGTLRYWRHIGTGPRSSKIGRKVVYTRDDLDVWIAEQLRETGRGGTAEQRRSAA